MTRFLVLALAPPPPPFPGLILNPGAQPYEDYGEESAAQSQGTLNHPEQGSALFTLPFPSLLSFLSSSSGGSILLEYPA